MYVIRLHPAIDTVVSASHIPCQGRFEVEVDSQSDWSELVSLVSNHLYQRPVKLRFKHNVLPATGAMKYWFEGLREIPILLYSLDSLGSDASTQTKFPNSGLPRTRCGPPVGLSRFKYLKIRDTITKK